jgi:hypothetical protein
MTFSSFWDSFPVQLLDFWVLEILGCQFLGNGGAREGGKLARDSGAHLHRSCHQDGVSDIDAYQQPSPEVPSNARATLKNPANRQPDRTFNQARFPSPTPFPDPGAIAGSNPEQCP